MSNNKNNGATILKNIITIVAIIIVCVLGFNTFFNKKTTQTDSQTDAPKTQTTTTTNATLDWNENTAPNYYAITGKSDFEPKSLEIQPGNYQIWKDDQNRPSLVTGNITYKMRDEGTRRERDNLPNPLGWPKNKQVTIAFSDGTEYHGWLFNRSHLLAKSLGGPDTKDNLVTGTRTQNVGNNNEDGGMGHTETEARDWLDKNKNGTILYEVEPIYVENEIIPRVVAVDIKSSDGQIDEHVITYNAAKGFEIDYLTGDWKQVA